MKKMLLLVGMGFLLFSCNSDGTSSSEKNGQNTSRKGKDLNCKALEQLKDDYSGLLTKEEMASVYPIDFENAKEKLRSGSYGEYIFYWPSDRPQLNLEVVGKKLKIADNNAIGIKNFSYSDSDIDLKSLTETFNMAYKELSEEELERINKNLAKQSEEIKSTGQDMMKVRAKSSWEFIDGLGTSAWYKWNENYGGEMAVMAGKAQFYIIIKISADPKENRDLARKLAEKVISKC
ncbi:MAG TPA: hypothetical protein VLZ83_11095 [Edaphocola sp.]|nr:hypothetical protein [Edaphocola sp.]